jgi:hypothetical protein
MQGARGRGGRAVVKLALGAFCVWASMVASAAAAPTIEGVTISTVTSTSAFFEAEINPQGEDTRYRFEYGLVSCASEPCARVPSKGVEEQEVLEGGSPVLVKVSVTGLTPATIYHFRAVARNSKATTGTDHLFATYGLTFLGLPDARVYEQASPVSKDGSDAEGQQSIVKASLNGDSISLGSTFGIPGGKGAQALPTYQATRGEGQSGWSTQGLLPPIGVGERAKVMGWLPDRSEIFSKAIRLGNPRTEALVAQSTKNQAPPRLIAPYAVGAEDTYAGASADASTVLFEAQVKLPPKEGGAPIAEAVEGASNLYAWDRASGEVHLAGVMNTPAETEAALPKGAFAGPYDWSLGSSAVFLGLGGAAVGSYLQDMHAIFPDGDVYFTAAGSGQLYLRENPTKPQSPLNGKDECEDHSLACTIHVSASQKDNGTGDGGADSVGPQPAAFQAASVDGSDVFFTSHEKLTNEANTGPEQEKAAIARTGIGGGSIEAPQFIPKAAVGVVADGSHIYWANPATGSIGRADLDGENADPNFIAVPEGECEIELGVKVRVPSTPRYLAVDSGHIYWTNTGRFNNQEEPQDGGGTIGRAKLDGEVASIEPALICGASNPQGIAVNATRIYWANAALQEGVNRSIARAAIGGGTVEEKFFETGSDIPYGVALSATHVYFDRNEEGNQNGYIGWIPLEGGGLESGFVGKSGLRGLAVDGGHVYWASQGEGSIGRADLELEKRESKFLEVEGKVNGVAVDGAHLYWASNGESATNAGNDLYRYLPATGALSDLTALPGGNGAEVQGVLGVFADGSYVYFAANGVLAGGASQGDCKGSVGTSRGSCGLYLWHAGQIEFVAPLSSESSRPDAFDWVGTPRDVVSSGSYFPKSAFLGDGGRTLVFRSQNKLSEYDNEGTPEYYRYRAGEPGAIRCLTCRPSGEDAQGGPGLTSIVFPSLQPPDSVEAVSSRNLSADGNRFFFETTEALSPEDTNGAGGCLFSGSGSQSFPQCLDVYEWEAPGSGSCTEGGPAYSPLNGGCLFLISTGKSKFPSLFADASESGNDVFFFTRQSLVGQDKDELQDVYDARVGGGLAPQNPQPVVPCESPEACHGPAQTPPAQSTATPTFVGPGNQVPKHKKQKAKKKHKAKKHKKSHKANAKGRTGR